MLAVQSLVELLLVGESLEIILRESSEVDRSAGALEVVAVIVIGDGRSQSRFSERFSSASFGANQK